MKRVIRIRYPLPYWIDKYNVETIRGMNDMLDRATPGYRVNGL